MSKLQSLIKAAILKKVQQELEKKQPGILLPNVPGADRDRTQEVVPISDADVIDYKNRQPGDDPKIGGQFQKLQGKFRAEALTPGSSEKDLQFWQRQHPDKHKEQLLSNLTRSFSGGAVASTPSKHAFVGHVKTNENRPDLEQKVREHEGNHLVFHAIEKKYGREGKEKFLDHILSSFKPETVRHFYKKYQSHYPNIDSLALKEEIANYMHNTLSGKPQREYAFEGMPEHEMRALDQDLKGGFKRFAQSQKGIDESFFTGDRLAANEFKRSSLIKGAMRRLAPFNPNDVSDSHRRPLEEWVGGYNAHSPDKVPRAPKNSLLRGMNKLHSLTASRRNPSTGEREFLLHRGMRPSQSQFFISSGSPGQLSSWTPIFKIAQNFAEDYLHAENHSDSREHEKNYGIPLDFSKPHVHSAWVPESQIHHIPNSIGTKSKDYNQNEWELGAIAKKPMRSDEHEVIVRPHRFQIESNPEKYSLSISQPSIRDRLKKRISKPKNTFHDSAVGFGRQRKLTATEFQKTTLNKAPIKYEGELFNHPQQVKTSEEKPFVNEKTTQALPNGLTHKILHGDQKTIHELYDKDKLVGTLTVVNNQVRDSQVSSEEQGRNYGKSLYSAALRHHGQLESDTLVSPAAAHQWQRLGAMNNVDYRPAPYLTNEEYQSWINEGMNPDSPHEPFKAQVTGQLDDKEAFPEVKPK